VLNVRVNPRAKHNLVNGAGNGRLLVRTTAPPADGKANRVVIGMLAKYLGITPSRISLLRGGTTRDKQFLIRDGALEL
jgi:uncharacterized protein (TIGR00251 family)